MKMSLFSWLLLGHLVGDWLLQNDEMARGKHSSIISQHCIFHCAIYSLTELIVLWIVSSKFSPSPSYFLFGLGIFFSHWLIDAFNLAAHWGRWIKQTDTMFVRIMVDQTLHLLTLALLVEMILI